MLLGLFTAFGTMNVALPFLLDFLRLQADLFQLYLLGSVITGRLSTGLAAMHAVVIALLGACAMLGQISWRRMMQAALAGIGILAAVAMSAQNAGSGLVLSSLPDRIVQILGVTNFLEFVESAASVDEAIEKLDGMNLPPISG